MSNDALKKKDEPPISVREAEEFGPSPEGQINESGTASTAPLPVEKRKRGRPKISEQVIKPHDPKEHGISGDQREAQWRVQYPNSGQYHARIDADEWVMLKHIMHKRNCGVNEAIDYALHFTYTYQGGLKELVEQLEFISKELKISFEVEDASQEMLSELIKVIGDHQNET